MSRNQSSSADPKVVKPPKYKHERKRWSRVDDVVLISSWLNTSKDAIVANEQKSMAFWKRVAVLFNSSPKIVAGEERDDNACNQRWRKINTQVCLFCGAYEQPLYPPKSGFDVKDYIKLAHEIFLGIHIVKFMLEHCLNELRYDQKWCTNSYSQGEGSGKKRKTGASRAASGAPVSASGADGASGAATGATGAAEADAPAGGGRSVEDLEDEVMVRPPGVKAAKAKAKRTIKNAEREEKLKAFQLMTESRQKDLLLKSMVCKGNCLERLLAKTEPLSEVEEALKNKLMNEKLEN